MVCGGDAGNICLQWYWWLLIMAVIAFVFFKLELPGYVSCALRLLALVLLILLVGYFCWGLVSTLISLS